MHRKLIAIALALALIGMSGTAVTADNGGGAVVADFEMTEELSPNPNGELKDGGSCSAFEGPTTEGELKDGGSC